MNRDYTNSPLINKSSSLSLFLLLCQLNSPPTTTPTPAPTATPAPAHKPKVAAPAKIPVTIVLVLVTVPVVTRVTLVPHTAAGTTLNKPTFAPIFANFLVRANSLTPRLAESSEYIGSMLNRKIFRLLDGWSVHSCTRLVYVVLTAKFVVVTPTIVVMVKVV